MKNGIINLDGVKMELQPPDIDQDGEVGGVEKVQQNVFGEVTNVVQPTEAGEVIKELNKDELEPTTRMSGIDMRSRLHHLEISSILAVDSLVALGCLPTRCLAFTRQKKRLAVSLDGSGREDIVRIVGGRREHEEKVGMSLAERGKAFVGGN
jgi:hypothetical protein